jgi:hypothetical protein
MRLFAQAHILNLQLIAVGFRARGPIRFLTLCTHLDVLSYGRAC